MSETTIVTITWDDFNDGDDLEIQKVEVEHSLPGGRVEVLADKSGEYVILHTPMTRLVLLLRVAPGVMTSRVSEPEDESVEWCFKNTDESDSQTCDCCGSGLNEVFPCKECGEMICQDCSDVHICEPE